MDAYIQCGRNKVYHRNLIVEMALFFVHIEMHRENTIP